MLATCAIDKTVKLWDTSCCSESDASETVAPVPCGSRDMGVGKLYTLSFYPSSPWLLGTGGAGNQLSLWDLSGEAAVRKRFGNRVSNAEVGGYDENNAAEEIGTKKEEDFEAMMAAGDATVVKLREASKSKKSGKNKKKNKKRAHRAGR